MLNMGLLRLRMRLLGLRLRQLLRLVLGLIVGVKVDGIGCLLRILLRLGSAILEPILTQQ